jgi:hypothetical protein
MSRILVFDHQFNVEAISSAYAYNSSVKIYQSNSDYSFYDNYDLVKPDIVLINKNYKEKIPLEYIEDINHKIYDLPYFLFNSNIKINLEKIYDCILIIKNFDKKYLHNKTIKFGDSSVKIFSLSPISHEFHYQYCGHITSSKDLHNLINSSNNIVSDTEETSGICNFLNVNFYEYSSDNKHKQQKQKKEKLINSTDFAKKYIS